MHYFYIYKIANNNINFVKIGITKKPLIERLWDGVDFIVMDIETVIYQECIDSQNARNYEKEIINFINTVLGIKPIGEIFLDGSKKIHNQTEWFKLTNDQINKLIEKCKVYKIQ